MIHVVGCSIKQHSWFIFYFLSSFLFLGVSTILILILITVFILVNYISVIHRLSENIKHGLETAQEVCSMSLKKSSLKKR